MLANDAADFRCPHCPSLRFRFPNDRDWHLNEAHPRRYTASPPPPSTLRWAGTAFARPMRPDVIPILRDAA